MKKIVTVLVLIGFVITLAVIFLKPVEIEQSDVNLLKAKYTKEKKSTVDHSKFAVLQKTFSKPQQVTEACIGCHTERHKEVMASNHWNWEREEYVEGRGIIYVGKKNAINNFCIGVDGNEQSCAKCHVGFGMTDQLTAFTDQTNIDCLVCHDQTETYTKASEKGGAPDMTIDFNKIAQNVGTPKRSNCGVCHFFGGGGNNVKHGDLEKSMFEPLKEVDVHMGIDGVNMNCVSCHTSENHMMLGRVYSLSSMNRNRSTCEQCHGNNPHEDGILNEHTIKVACQSCHIPIYAKVNATKTYWDWSTAGKLKNGEPYEEDDADGNHTYLSIKGTFEWGKNLKPEYIWFNGTADHYLLGDLVNDTSNPLKINNLKGSYNDKESKIIPVKIHRARQPFDPINKMLIQPKLFSDKYGEGALWKDFDWSRASEVGMKDVNLPYSGRYTFINTEMTWPINHMVSTKEKTVDCIECHTRNESRLAGLDDFYMPSRDYSPIVETTGKLIILLTLLGVLLHFVVRIYASRKLNGRRK
ncbi:MAG: tetrathionate reductase family octaheme c-type cytochrome [Ignavibacteria bacterium]|nr:tetrathionate reductase family octaheme c-type cytochrome [Ignavibacteria bacterium]